MVLGYAYPAYECYKAVELNRPEIEHLRFWCQYWILVAVLTVFERVGDAFISWLPMYSEAKLAFFVYLWYPKTKGTKYVYDTFFRPYVAKHETEIDRNLLELRTRAGDIAVLYWEKAASYGQTRFFEILQYIAAQSQSQPSQPRQKLQQREQPVQNQRTQSEAASPAPQAAASHPPEQPTRVQASLTRRQYVQAPANSSYPSASSSLQTQTSDPSATRPPPSENADHSVPAGVEMLGEATSSMANEDLNLFTQEMPMEEAVHMTRGRLRRNAAIAGLAGR